MTTTQSPLRFAIMGCGGIIAASHIAALNQVQSEGAQIAAMCDINPETGKPRADAAGVPFFTDYASCWKRSIPTWSPSARHTRCTRPSPSIASPPARTCSPKNR